MLLLPCASVIGLLSRDHAGGNEEIARLIPGIEIVGGEHDHVSAATKQVCAQQKIRGHRCGWQEVLLMG